MHKLSVVRKVFRDCAEFSPDTGRGFSALASTNRGFGNTGRAPDSLYLHGVLFAFGKCNAVDNLRKTSTRVLGCIGLDFRHLDYLFPKMSTNVLLPGNTPKYHMTV